MHVGSSSSVGSSTSTLANAGPLSPAELRSLEEALNDWVHQQPGAFDDAKLIYRAASVGALSKTIIWNAEGPNLTGSRFQLAIRPGIKLPKPIPQTEMAPPLPLSPVPELPPTASAGELESKAAAHEAPSLPLHIPPGLLEPHAASGVAAGEALVQNLEKSWIESAGCNFEKELKLLYAAIDEHHAAYGRGKSPCPELMLQIGMRICDLYAHAPKSGARKGKTAGGKQELTLPRDMHKSHWVPRNSNKSQDKFKLDGFDSITYDAVKQRCLLLAGLMTNWRTQVTGRACIVGLRAPGNLMRHPSSAHVFELEELQYQTQINYEADREDVRSELARRGPQPKDIALKLLAQSAVPASGPSGQVDTSRDLIAGYIDGPEEIGDYEQWAPWAVKVGSQLKAAVETNASSDEVKRLGELTLEAYVALSKTAPDLDTWAQHQLQLRQLVPVFAASRSPAIGTLLNLLGTSVEVDGKFRGQASIAEFFNRPMSPELARSILSCKSLSLSWSHGTEHVHTRNGKSAQLSSSSTKFSWGEHTFEGDHLHVNFFNPNDAFSKSFEIFN